MEQKIKIAIGGMAIGERKKPVVQIESNSKKKLTDQQITQIKELHDQGMSQRKIAAEVGSNPTTVRKVIKGEY